MYVTTAVFKTLDIYIYIFFHIFNLEIIKEVETNGDNLTDLLRVRGEELEPYCLERALIAAVRNGNHFSVGKLVVKGATNVEDALQLSKEMKKHEARAMLLLVLAALKNDKDLILKLFSTSFENPTSVSIIQSSINTYCTVWYVYTCQVIYF